MWALYEETHQRAEMEKIRELVSSLTEMLEEYSTSELAELNPIEIMSCAFVTMSSFPSDLSMRALCSHLLHQAIRFAKMKSLESEAVDSIHTAMENSLGSACLQIDCLSLLASIVDPSDKLSDSAAGTARKVVVRSMNAHSDNLILQCVALNVMQRMVGASTCRKQWREEVGTIIKAFKDFPRVLPIQHSCLILLLWLARDGSCLEEMRNQDGVILVTQAMAMHAQDEVLQCHAAVLLCWFMHGGGGGGGEWNQNNNNNNNNHATIMSAVYYRSMMTHVNHAATFCSCVRLVSGVGDLASANLAREVIFQTVMEGMTKHRSNVLVQQACLQWIRFQEMRRFEDEISKFCIAPILQAMKDHAKDASLQAKACDLLASFVGSPTLGRTMLEQGAADSVIVALKLHGKDVRVQQGAAWFLVMVSPLTPTTLAFGAGLPSTRAIWRALDLHVVVPA